MQISDILSFFGILLAIYALIDQKERRIILLKTSILDYALMIVLFLSINYLVMFDVFYNWGYYIERTMVEKGFLASQIAYFVLFGLLLFMLAKVFSKRYPLSNHNDVIYFYRELSNTGDAAFLFRLLKRMHRRQILRFIDRNNART